MMNKSFLLLFSMFIGSGCQIVSNQMSPSQNNETPLAGTISTIPTLHGNDSIESELTITSDQNEDMSELEKHPHVFKAKDDLATRISFPFDQIKVALVRSITWPDSSLGCPQPDMAYTQVEQDGMLIQLQAGGFIYNYHSGENRNPFLCIKTSSSKAPSIKLDPSMARTPLSDDFDQ